MNEKEEPAANGAPAFTQLGKVTPPAKVAYILHLLLAGIVAIVGSALWTERDAPADVQGGTFFLLFMMFALPALVLLVAICIYSVKGRSEWPLLLLLAFMVATLAALMTGSDETTWLIVIFVSMYVAGTVLFAILWFSKNRKNKLARPA